MKRILSWLLVLVMVVSMLPLAAFADEAEVLYSQQNLELITQKIESGDIVAVPHEASVSVPADGTVTVNITSVDPGVKFALGDSLPKEASAAGSYEFDVTAGEYVFSIYGYHNYSDVAATVSFDITFAASEGGSGETEKTEYIVSSQALNLEGNALTLDTSAVTTIYAFTPAETGVYSFTADNGAVVGYWGAGDWYLVNPGSTGSSCEWTCTGDGQSAYIGVSGVDSCNLTVAKTGEYVDTSIQWVTYQNLYNPADYFVPCLTVVEGEGDYTLVNFNDASLSIVSVLGTTGAKYSDVENGIYIDYTAALQEYVDASAENGYYFYLTEDLYEMLPRLYESMGWNYKLSSWEDLLVTAVEEHTNTTSSTGEDGYTYEVCNDCGFLVYTDCPGYYPENPIIIEFDMNEDWTAGTATITLEAYESWWYGVYTYGMNMTINGEEAVFDIEASNPRMPSAIFLWNGSSEAVTYELALYTPAPEVGAWNNPAALVLGENIASIEAGSQGYYYNWVATDDGVLTITMPDGGWTYVINNLTTGVYGYTQWSDSDPVVNPGTVAVAEGDKIEIIVNSYDPENMWNNPAAELVITADLFGTEENPIDLTVDLLYENDFSATVTVPAGATYYYCAYRVGGMTMSINGGESVTCVTEGMMAPYIWSISNDGEEAAEYVITVAHPVGSQNKPAELVLGENTASIEAGSQGYFYNWVATDDGVLTITMPDGGWTYVINNMTTGSYADTQWSDSDPVVNPGTVVVAEGDEIEIIVNTYDSANPWVAPAGTITFTASFEAAEVDAPCAHENVEHVEESCYNTEYWFCPDCEIYWADEALIQNTNRMNVIKAVPSHVAEHTPESCYNTEYWYCAACDTYFADEALTQNTNRMNVIKAVPSHEAEHTPESCYNTEFWYCVACDTYFADEALTQNTNSKNVIKAVPTHEAEHIPESCYNTEFWYCAACDTYFADEALTQNTNSKNVIKAVPSHEAEHTPESCYNTEFWYCAACDTYFADEALTQNTNSKNVIKAVPSHEAEHTPESCYNTEYWYCEACDTYFADEALTQNTNSKNVIKAVPTHEAEHFPETCYNTEFWYCAACDTYFADEALTQNTNRFNVIKAVPSHNAQHFEAVEPECHFEGNVEYWICYECETVWTDEALTQQTNIKNVVLPATGEGDMVHVEAVDPTCVANGNIEHWYCKICDKVWQDEALTQLTNHMNVILGIDEDAHEYEHVKTVEATCTTQGQEHYECELCGFEKVEYTSKIPHVDKDPKDNKCDVCSYDMTNSTTGDMVMISAVVMILAACAVVFMLNKKRYIV